MLLDINKKVRKNQNLNYKKVFKIKIILENCEIDKNYI